MPAPLDAGPAADRASVGPSRRRVLLAGACLAGVALPATARAAREDVRVARPLMGTRVDIAVRGEAPAQARVAIDAAFARMAALADAMSHYSATSSVAAIGLASGLQPVPASRELLQVLAMARDVSQRSGGAFDVTVGSLGRWHFDPRDPRMPAPAAIRSRLGAVDWRALVLDERAGTAFLKTRGMRLDLGGIAKLYILRAGLDTLRAHGLRTALVNGGGDVVAIGAPGSAPWRVGIRDPRAPARLLARLDLREGYVASSGDYERFFVRDGRRYHHVIDPRTGFPTEGPHGVTLVGRELEQVNGLGAAAMVLGLAEGRGLIRASAGTEGLIAGAGGELWISPALRERLAS